jgi:hypothetical protein
VENGKKMFERACRGSVYLSTMFLKNYTSNVPVSDTIHRIEKVLLRCGVTGIMKEYGLNAKVVAVSFQIDTPAGKKAVRLPADEERAIEALWLDYVGDDMGSDGKVLWSSRKRKTKSEFIQQGERTAWKIVQDWVEVQMSMIQMKQADVLQVFLPYLYDGRRTYYQALKEANYAGLLTNSSGDES